MERIIQLTPEQWKGLVKTVGAETNDTVELETTNLHNGRTIVARTLTPQSGQTRTTFLVNPSGAVARFE